MTATARNSGPVRSPGGFADAGGSDAFWSHESIRSASGGVWLQRPAAPHRAQPLGVAIDTRALKPGQVFIAIKGERTDGHRYLAQAHAAGASLAIIDNPGAIDPPEGMGIIHVSNSVDALERLARVYRRALDPIRVVAVTGSCGKTTTTRLIESVLRTTLRGTASIKSYNNRLGVALTILGTRSGDRFLVCEVGSSAPGEVARLAAMVMPDIAVVTSIGPAHLAGLGSLEEVAHEKAALARALAPEGLAIVPALKTQDHPGIKALDAELIPVEHVLRVGWGDRADLRITGIEHDEAGLVVTLADRTTYRLALLGEHNALNAALAIAVGRRFGLDHEDIARGLADARAEPGRLSRRRAGSIEILDDCYNANPQSMRAGLETLIAVGRGATRRVAVLGDMLELADQSRHAHAQLGEYLGGTEAIDLVILIGPAMNHARRAMIDAGGASRCCSFDSTDESAAIARLVQPGDLVLVKGSRSMGLERVIEAIESHQHAPAPAGAPIA